MKTLNRSTLLKAMAPAMLVVTLFLVSPGAAQAQSSRSVGIELGTDGIGISFASSRDFYQPQPVVVVPTQVGGPRYHYAPASHSKHFKPGASHRTPHGPKFTHGSRAPHGPKFTHGAQAHRGPKFTHANKVRHAPRAALGHKPQHNSKPGKPGPRR